MLTWLTPLLTWPGLTSTSTSLTVLLSLAGATLVALAGWWLRGNAWLAGLQVVLLLGSGLTAALQPQLASQRELEVLVVTLCALLALAGGGPLTTAVFRLVDGPSEEREGSMSRAAEVLRGGAWIGALERTAVFASLATRWPEGIAISLALKGLGRYPELRNEERTGIAERFLIGTFVSVLWAAGCAGVALLLTG